RAATAWTVSSACSATATGTATWTGWTATFSGPRSGNAPAMPATCGTSTSTATAMWTVWTTGSSTAASASIERLRKAAGEVLTAKQAPHRPGTAPALGLRAGNDVPHSIADQPRKGELTMSFNSWLQNLRSALAPGRGQRDHKRRGSLRAATHRPNLEG